MDHPRRFSIDMTHCPPLCPEEPSSGPTDVLCFISDHKLLAHAVGHYANTLEMRHWRQCGGYDEHAVSGCIDTLRDLNCPFFRLNMAHLPPCNVKSHSCTCIDRCFIAAAPLMEAYVRAIRVLLEESAGIPRYARFNDQQSDCFCFMFSDRSIVVKLIWNRNAYNVMTAHHPMAGKDIAFRNILEHQIRRISREAESHIAWCTETTWGLIPEDPETDDDCGRTPQRKNKNSGRKRRYIRGGSRNFRQYYEDEDER